MQLHGFGLGVVVVTSSRGGVGVVVMISGVVVVMVVVVVIMVVVVMGVVVVGQELFGIHFKLTSSHTSSIGKNHKLLVGGNMTQRSR